MNTLENKLYIIFHYKIIKYSCTSCRIATSYIKRVKSHTEKKRNKKVTPYKKSSCVV